MLPMTTRVRRTRRCPNASDSIPSLPRTSVEPSISLPRSDLRSIGAGAVILFLLPALIVLLVVFLTVILEGEAGPVVRPQCRQEASARHESTKGVEMSARISGSFGASRKGVVIP